MSAPSEWLNESPSMVRTPFEIAIIRIALGWADGDCRRSLGDVHNGQGGGVLFHHLVAQSE